MYRKLISLVTEQDVYNRVFLSSATEGQKEFFHRKMSARTVSEVDRMEKIAMGKAAEGNFGVDPTYWFNTMTEKINLLKKVEDRLSSDLVAKAEELRGVSQNQLILFAVITAFIIFITRSLMKQLGGEPALMRDMAFRVAQGDLTLDSQKDRERASGVYVALLNMLEALKYKADIVKQIAEKYLTVAIEKASDKVGLGDSLIEMKEFLNLLLSQIDTSAEQVASGADQVSQASQSLSRGATEQASKDQAQAIDQITGGLEQIDQVTQTNTASAEESASAAEELASQAQELRRMISQFKLEKKQRM